MAGEGEEERHPSSSAHQKVDSQLTGEEQRYPLSSSSLSTSSSAEEEEGVVENPLIMGCRWPHDYHDRYIFCAHKAGLDSTLAEHVSRSARVQYGVLDHGVLDRLMGSCQRDDLAKCVRRLSDETVLDEFVEEWHASVHNYTVFEQCLQSNTEAMNRLCGSDTRVSRIVSGAAGLQLNILNVLVRMSSTANMTETCNRAIASAVHVTAALYIKSEHYRDNSVMCWNAAREHCSTTCSAFAAQLNCLQSACSTVPISTLQQLGIWQWYFLDTSAARLKCDITDDKCSVTDDGANNAHKGEMGFASLLDAATLKKRFGEVRLQLEHRLHMPFARIALIAVGIASLSCGLCIVLCAWYYGVWGRRRRTTRYSRLLDERISTGGFEGKSLTHTIDDEIDD